MNARAGLFALLWLAVAPAWAGTVRATLDRSQARMGETVTLNITVQGGPPATTPDLSPLQQDFRVLGSSSGTSLSIINGRRSQQYTVGVALQPRHAGHLTVPALAVGGERTAPLTLEVGPAGAGAAHAAGAPVFVEAAVEPGRVRVGQQALLTVRLFIAGNLANGALEDPHADGLDVRRLGRDLDYQAERDGRSYRVVERRYAIVPQRAGTLTLPPLAFQGQLLDPNDPDSFFNMGTPVAAASPAVPLHVLAPPADWGASAWLPAREVDLQLSGWPADGRIEVGQPLQLSMTLQARGLPYETLPELSLPKLDGASVYPDKPVTRTGTDGQWLLGERTQTFALVADRPGPLKIPAITIKWWNVQSGRAETARIPPRTLTVVPALARGTGPAPPASAPAPAPVAAAGPASRASAPAAASRPAIVRPGWAAVAAATIAILVLLGGGLVWRRRRAAAAATGSSRRARRAAFLRAARGDDSGAQAHALLAWARAERPGTAHLGALAEALDSPRQREAILTLERRRYAAAPGGTQADLAAVFANGFAWRTGAGGAPDASGGPLPPLYPFRTR